MLQHKPLVLSGYRLDAIDPERAVEICRASLEAHPRRLAFAGKIGAGKTSVCEAIAGTNWPVINHADSMKEEVLEYLADALTKGVFREADNTIAFTHFCHYMGFTPAVVETDLWELLGPLWHDFQTMAQVAIARDLGPQLRFFHTLQSGEYLGHKVAWINERKDFIRDSLVSYGQVQKELCANPSHWVERTIERSIPHPVCLNGDTRFTEAELEPLSYCGWSSIYLWIDRATQEARHPGLRSTQYNAHTEVGIAWCDCDFVIDARRPLADVLLTLSSWLGDPQHTLSFLPFNHNGGFSEVAEDGR